MTTPAPNASLRARLQQLLREKRAEIGEELSLESSERYRDIAGDVADEGDASVGDQLVEEENALIGRHVHEVREIEAALARIESGNYGICESCGKEIAAARLKANPTSTRCTPCAAARERIANGTPRMR